MSTNINISDSIYGGAIWLNQYMIDTENSIYCY